MTKNEKHLSSIISLYRKRVKDYLPKNATIQDVHYNGRIKCETCRRTFPEYYIQYTNINTLNGTIAHRESILGYPALACHCYCGKRWGTH